jgi:hypothetical protein
MVMPPSRSGFTDDPDASRICAFPVEVSRRPIHDTRASSRAHAGVPGMSRHALPTWVPAVGSPGGAPGGSGPNPTWWFALQLAQELTGV